MKHEIIKTDSYLLVVDESEIKNGDWVYFECLPYSKEIKQVTTIINNAFDSKEGFGYGLEYCKKIIAHLPLNDSPILEGVDLLPTLEEDVDRLADKYANQFMDGRDAYYGYKEGYNKAKEKYNANLHGILSDFYVFATNGEVCNHKIIDDFIQSLPQPKMPIGFECVMEKDFRYNDDGEPFGFKVHNSDKITTTTTPEGHTQWVGTYIYG